MKTTITKEWLKTEMYRCLTEEEDARTAGRPEREAYHKGKRAGLKMVLDRLLSDYSDEL